MAPTEIEVPEYLPAPWVVPGSRTSVSVFYDAQMPVSVPMAQTLLPRAVNRRARGMPIIWHHAARRGVVLHRGTRRVEQVTSVPP